MSGLPGYDPSYELVHYDAWSEFEEYGWIAILRKDAQLYEISGGYCVMAEGTQDDVFDPFPITEECALEEIMLWEGVD